MALSLIPQGERQLEHSEPAEEDCITNQRNEARERRCGVPSAGEAESKNISAGLPTRLSPSERRFMA